MMTGHELLVWAAGFIDGEGCITIAHQKRRSGVLHFVKIAVPQVNPAPLLLLKELFGGRISYHSRSKGGSRSGPRDIWKWEQASRKAAIAISKLRPYLIVKAQEADVALAFQSTVRHGQKLSEEIIATRYRQVTELKELKRAVYDSPRKEVSA